MKKHITTKPTTKTTTTTKPTIKTTTTTKPTKRTVTKFIPTEHAKHRHTKTKRDEHMLHSKSKPNLGTVGYQQIIGKSIFNPISHRKGWSKDKESKIFKTKISFHFWPNT